MIQNPPSILVIGAGIGGLTSGVLLAKQGYKVTVLEAQTYAGGSASTYYYQDYRFESGATLAGGFQDNGPHQLIAEAVDIEWPIHACNPAWVVHLPDCTIPLTQDYAALTEQFPQSKHFWIQQEKIADLCWELAARGLPWPPTSLAEIGDLLKTSLGTFPKNIVMLPYIFRSVEDWLKKHNLDKNPTFKRFIDAQLLISAQTTAQNANSLYGATALDLARQGVFHVEGGIGGIAETLVQKLKDLGGEIHYRHRVKQIQVDSGQVTGVHAYRGKHDKKGEFFPADFIIGNLTPWSLDELLGEHSSQKLQQEVKQRDLGWGAFVLHVGIVADKLPTDLPHHHQIVTSMDGDLGEGNSIFISISPEWDKNRAPEGRRAVTITTHTAVQQWWDLLNQDFEIYDDQKSAYQDKILNAIDTVIPNFSKAIDLVMAGTPVTYQYYTDRHLGMVGGFPQTSLFKARSPRTGIPNLRLVGDSIFPGQSTAGVTLGAIRVAKDVQQYLRKNYD